MKGGRVRPPRDPQSPQSRGRLSAVSVCQLEGCEKSLTGRQRVACSDSHRALASKQRRVSANTPTRTPQKSKSYPTTLKTTPLGSREPAYRSVPKHTTSRGPKAVDLMRRAGYTLDDWQIDVLEAALGLYKGRWAAPEVCVLAPRQNGKTEAAIAAALYVATSGPKKLVIVSSHETKTNEEVFLRMREVVETPAFDEFAPQNDQVLVTPSAMSPGPHGPSDSSTSQHRE
jgi:hypothetical protein